MIKSLKRIKEFLIQDKMTPQQTALGLGIGVFLGIIPGTGPVAALFMAWLLKINRTAALIASLATNGWLSIVTFLLAVKTGAWITGVEWKPVYTDSFRLLKEFRGLEFFKLSVIKVIMPLIAGYIIVGFGLGILVYLLTLIILIKRQKKPTA